MKEGCLFVLFVTSLRSPKPQQPRAMLFVLLETLLMSSGALSWCHNVLTYGGEVIKY
jgi:hypothetical protein